MARQNAVILLTYATVYPFRLPDATVMCVYCCKHFVDPAQFRQHMKDEHLSFKVKNAFVHCTSEDYLKVDCTHMTCRVCSNAFEKIDDMARHLNSVHDSKLNFDFDLGIHPFKLSREKLLCGVCDSNLPCLRRLSRHVSGHYQNYTCDLCGKCYTTATALKQHLTFTHIDNKTICRKCKKTFSSLEAKKEHVASSPNCWRYLCPLCSKRFITWTSKEEHLVDAHGLSKKMHTCSECGEQFNHRNSYRSHFKVMHTKENFSCSYCGRKFGEKRYLDEHTVTHTGLKMYHCQVCSKSFPRKSNLSQHMWLHSDVKRFECRVCDKKFNQRVSYKAHMKNHHPDVNQY